MSGLSQPITSKVLYRIGNKNYRIGCATMHGWRESMEDAHIIIPSMPKHKHCGFFGIFDGHSGSSCSHYIAKHLPENVDQVQDLTNVEQLREVVLKTDEVFLNTSKKSDDGSAGIFTVSMYDADRGVYHLINGNVGDSRTVLAKRNGKGNYEAVACTSDHKPNKEKEKERIENAGGTVMLGEVPRVDGTLALSRAFGDSSLKEPADADPRDKKVTSNPDWVKNNATKDDFLFMACDGIYEADIFNRDEVIHFIEKKLEETDDLAVICAMVVDECLKRGSRDNMSCMIIQFVDGTDYNKEKVYIPGPWHENDKVFQAAYIKDAEAAGWTIEEAHQLRKKLEEKSTNQK